MFAVLAGVSMLANVVLPGLANAATPDTELGEAYEWAYSKSITTMPSYEAANMQGKVTRAELAKMLSNWAMNVRGMTPDTSKTCEFTDTASVKGDLGEAITTSCQLGLMGQGISAFRPYDNISRAEFGTALSRALWGDKYEGGTPYYKNHLQALKAAGIMNYIDGNWPASQEVRGYVMLMLMRVVEGDEGTDSETPSDEVVKSGSLVVSSSAADDRSVIVATTGNAVSDLDTLTFKTSEEVTLNKVVLEQYWYAGDDLIKNVWLEDEDGNVISNETKPNSKGLVNLTLKKDYKKVDGSFNAVIVVETYPVDGEEDDNGNEYSSSASLIGSTTLGFKVTDVSSTAKDVDLGNYKAYTYNVVLYNGTLAKITAKGWEKDHNYEGKAVEVSKFKIKAPDNSAIKVTGFTLTNTGTLDIYDTVDASDVEVTVDGKTVKADVKINKDEEMTISLKETLELSAKQQVQVVVYTKFNSDFEDYGSTVILEVAKASDLSATDKNNARITVSWYGSEGKWVKYTINGGQVKITNTKLGNVDAALNSTDILIASGYITIGEDLEKWELVVKVSWNNPDAIEDMRLEIAGDEYDGKHNTNYTQWTFSNVEISQSGRVRLYVDTNSDTAEDKVAQREGQKYTLSIDGWDSFKYVNGSKTSKVDPSGSLTVSNLTIQAPEGTLTNTISSSDDVEFSNNSVDDFVVLDGTYKADKQDIYLNTFSITGLAATVLPENSKIRFYLYVDDMDTSVADVRVAGAAPWTDDFNDILVKAGESVKVKVVAEVDAKEITTGDNEVDLPLTIGKFRVDLSGNDVNDNPAGNAHKNTANMLIVDKGSVSVEGGEVASKAVLRKSSSAKIAQFIVKPDSASTVTLETISFILSGLDSYEGDVSLLVDGSDKNLKCDSSYSCTAEFTKEVDSNGVTVVVELDDELDGEVELTDLKVNDKPFTTRTFNKKFVDAVVWFTENNFSGDDQTTFTFWIDKKGSAVITWLKLNGNIEINNLEEIKAWVPYTVNHTEDMKAVTEVTSISYYVDGKEVNYNNTYSDMFRIGMKETGAKVQLGRLKNS